MALEWLKQIFRRPVDGIDVIVNSAYDPSVAKNGDPIDWIESDVIPGESECSMYGRLRTPCY